MLILYYNGNHTKKAAKMGKEKRGTLEKFIHKDITRFIAENV